MQGLSEFDSPSGGLTRVARAGQVGQVWKAGKGEQDDHPQNQKAN